MITTGNRTLNTRSKSPRWVHSREVSKVTYTRDRDSKRLARSVSSTYQWHLTRLVSTAAWRTRASSPCKTNRWMNNHSRWSNNKLRSSINSSQHRCKIRTVQPTQRMERKRSRCSSNRSRQVNNDQSSEAHTYKASRVAPIPTADIIDYRCRGNLIYRANWTMSGNERHGSQSLHW